MSKLGRYDLVVNTIFDLVTPAMMFPQIVAALPAERT
jgi:hypothetical protein